MNQVKLVHGAARNRTFATPAKQAELLEQRRKRERTDRLANKWFTVDENEPLTKSDIAMSIGVYVGMPIMLVASFIGALLV